MALTVGARQAREARVTAALMAAIYLAISGTRVRIAARHVLTTEVVIRANKDDN